MGQRPLETVPAAFSVPGRIWMQMHSDEWLIWSACLLCFSRMRVIVCAAMVEFFEGTHEDGLGISYPTTINSDCNDVGYFDLKKYPVENWRDS
jgi:hypothetical protein